MALPTITVKQLTAVDNDPSTSPNVKNVVEGIVNDFMDLQYGKSTPYTTGKQILPTGATVENVTQGLKDPKAPESVKNVLRKILEVQEKGDFTPQPNDGSWDPKLTPVLQLVRADD